MKKLSFILAIIMTLAAFPMVLSFDVFAADEEALIVETNAKYATLEEALTAVATGQTIKLLKNVTVDSNTGIILNTERNITIEGNNCTITSAIDTANRATFYVQKGSLTLKNLTMNVESSTAEPWGAVISRYEGSVITFEKCKINVDGSSGKSALGANTKGKIILKDTEVRSMFPVFLNYDGSCIFEANNSTAFAPSLGVDSVSGLTFTQTSAPFEGVTPPPAEEPDVPKVETAAIGDKVYYSLPDAFAAAKHGDTIKLLVDIDVTTTGSAGRIKCYGGGMDLVLDGNGKTITGIADTTLAIHYQARAGEDNGGALNLTIKNLTIGNKINDATQSGTALQVNTSTNVTLVDTTVTCGTNKWGAVVVQASGKLTLAKGAKIAPVIGNAVLLNGAAAALNVYEGSIVADSVVYTRNASTVMNVCQGADIVVKKEFVSSESTTGMALNILGGKIKSENASSGAITIPSDAVKVNILGGRIEGGKQLLTNKASRRGGKEYPDGQNYVDYTISVNKEANIRFVKNSCGLRFETTVPAAVIELANKIKDEGTELTFGTVITPAENLEATNGILDMSVLGNSDIDGTKYLRIFAKEGKEQNANGDVTIRASMVNLKTENYGREFASAGFISLVIGGERVYVYSDVMTQSAKTSAEALKANTTLEAARVKILENYINGVLNHDPNAISGGEAPLTETTKKILSNTKTIFRTIGRTYSRNNGLACDFAATGIEFNALCEGEIYLNINTTAQAYLTVYIDGERFEERISVTPSKPWVRVAYDIERGDHTIMIVNQSQFNMATLILNEVRISGEFKDKPADRELFFEFYGDSILNGSNVYLGGTSAKTSDATKAFGWIAAEQLGADCSIMGHGGLGLVASKNSYNMVDLYDLCGSAKLSGVPKYDFARKPDAVIIELGVNDYVNGGLSSAPDTYAAGVEKFIGDLRAKYGKDVPIVWVYGYRDDVKDFWATTKTALDKLVAAGDSNIHYCKVNGPYYLTSAQGGDGWHPNVKMATAFGNDVAAFLKDLLKIAE